MKKKEDPKKEKPQKDKKPEHPQRSKHKPAKKTPSRIYRGKSKEDKARTELRRRAVERAAAQLRRFAIPFDRGDSIIMCTRHKVMLAFDHPIDAIPGLQANADTAGAKLIHFGPEEIGNEKLFDAVLVNCIDVKPLYAGKKGGMVSPVKVPNIKKTVRRAKAKKAASKKSKLSVKQDKSPRTKKIEKSSKRRLTR